VTLTFKVATQTLRATRHRNMVIISVKYFRNQTSNNKVMGQHDFAARSCCDLDLQGSEQNVARDTSSQYGDHSCEIFSKSNFK